MSHYDLVIKGGKVANADSTAICDVGITDGRIVALGDGLTGAREINATGRIVTPGGIDAHCHIEQLTSTGARTADSFATASRAAAFGGTTTLMPFAAQHRGMSLRSAVEDYRELMGNKSEVDCAFHMIVTDPTADTLARDLPALASEGFTSVKIYLSYEALKLDDQAALDVLAVCRAERLMTMVHAESHDLIAWLTDKMVSSGYDSLKYFPRSRPPLAERDATHHAIAMAELVSTPILIVHVSSIDALAEIERARAAGKVVFAETCPQYLLLNEGDMDRPGFEAAKYCCSPPLRSPEHREALWNGLAQGIIEVYSSDHSAFFFNGVDGKKRNGEDAPFTKVPYGMPGLETRMPLLFSEGFMRGRLSLERFVNVTATRPAEIYGLPAKGKIAEGYDADIVIWNQGDVRTVSTGILHDGLDYTPYEGIEVKGWPENTILRGKVLCEYGRWVADQQHGRLLSANRVSASQFLPPATGFDVTHNKFVHH